MDALRSTRNWLKNRFISKLRQGSDSSESRKLSIGQPTNFRREPITLGADIDGNAVILEQAREDAQDMHREQKQKAKTSKMGAMCGHISAKFGGSNKGDFRRS